MSKTQVPVHHLELYDTDGAKGVEAWMPPSALPLHLAQGWLEGRLPAAVEADAAAAERQAAEDDLVAEAEADAAARFAAVAPAHADSPDAFGNYTPAQL